ncbi:MAG TPA: non-homologous end-joining DNA ligase [Candidatus Dormibacteraeota bacterium]|jgi:bifunctional non-homologous end joining protein LigD|nr:non-homologous end-joining DNA ligase [Candidatus Dormibacteraeota bacterium]
MSDLKAYRAKRSFDKTPEPAGAEEKTRGEEPRFVVQEHHARRLHWDFRLEHDGVLVSWALPKGLPADPHRNNLAVHVEDHPLDYIDFAGQIPGGEYGAGSVSIWDSGTYEIEKWRLENEGGKPEVMITLHGSRVEGRYVLFQTRGKDWMIHRMSPPDESIDKMPEGIRPMLAQPFKALPDADAEFAYEFKWDGARGLVFCRPGEVRAISRSGEDITRRYPELQRLMEPMGSRTAILDGEVVALDESGIPRFGALQNRIGLNDEREIRRMMRTFPVVYMAFDLLYLDGHLLMEKPYLERRRLLLELKLSGPSWQTPEHQVGGGADMLQAARDTGLEGVVAKRTTSAYHEGRRTPDWRKVKATRRQELVIGGWQEGEGKRAGYAGALLVGYWDGDDFVYAGKAGTGFTEAMLRELKPLLEEHPVDEAPFSRGRPPTKAVHFIEPRMVAEFEFLEWTGGGQMRAPVFQGLRRDKDPREVVREDG